MIDIIGVLFVLFGSFFVLSPLSPCFFCGLFCVDLSGGSVSSTLGQMPTMAATNSSPSNNLLDEFDMFAASRQSFDQNKPMK